MGWSNGPYLAGEVWGIVREEIQDIRRQEVAREIIRAFCGYDADDWCEQEQLLEDAGFPMDGEDDEIDQFWDELGR